MPLKLRFTVAPLVTLLKLPWMKAVPVFFTMVRLVPGTGAKLSVKLASPESTTLLVVSGTSAAEL